MKNTIVKLCLSLLIAAPLGCSNSLPVLGTPAAQHALLRIVHDSPDAPAVDVLLDDEIVASDVPYLTSSPYLAVTPGQRNIKVNAAGTSTTVIDATPDLEGNRAYTVIATNFLANIEPLVLEDDLTPPAFGTLKIRIVHGSPTAPDVDVYLTDPNQALAGQSPALADVPFLADSGYLEIPAGSYRARVTVAGDPLQAVVIDSGTLDLAAGSIITVIAVDNTGGGAPFGFKILDDLGDASP